ncbi:hypothetical protein, partial [Streptomyces sp. NPDC055013]
TVAAGRLSTDGNFTGLTTGGGLSTNWTNVVPVDRELFFYNASTGTVAAGRLSTDGNFTGLTTGGGLSTNWTNVVPVTG